MIQLFHRLANIVKRKYYKVLFKSQNNIPHSNFSILGKIFCINHNITIGNNVSIYPGVVFWGNGPIVIGDNVTIGYNTIIYASNEGGVTIESNTNIAAQCYIIDMDHSFDREYLIREQKNSVCPIKIESDVWIGANVTILKGSCIGKGAVIGAKCLVKNVIPSYGIAVGIPARIIKYRN